MSLEPGDRAIFCSGLTSLLTEAVAEILARTPPGRPEEACRALVEAAIAAGGRDNITVVVVEVAC